MTKYFLQSKIPGSEAVEVSLEEYCRGERSAGFRPKLSSDHPDYMTTPATGGFSSGYLTGSIRYYDE